MSVTRAKADTAVAPANEGAHDGHYSEAAMTSTFNGVAALASIVPRSTSWTLVITGRGLPPRGAAACSCVLILRNPSCELPVKAVDLDGDRMRRVGPPEVFDELAYSLAREFSRRFSALSQGLPSGTHQHPSKLMITSYAGSKELLEKAVLATQGGCFADEY
jgi:hypothetical protein